MNYTFAIESFADTYGEMQPLYRTHYAEMEKRLAGEGINISPYNPDVAAYTRAQEDGRLTLFIVRTAAGEPIGYSSIYISRDMHNQDLIATEDTVFVRADHRKGVGRMLVKAILAYLRNRGCKRAFITATTDPRAVTLWRRLGFRPMATTLTYHFD